MINDKDFLQMEFPVTSKVVYLNTASIGIAPSSTITAMNEFLGRYQDESICDAAKSFGVLDRCRRQVANMIGADIDEISFQPNTSYGINVLAHGFPLLEGDEVLIPEGEFPANVLPWKALASKGVKIRLIEISGDVIDSLNSKITSRTRVIAVSAVSFADGYAFDLARLSEICNNMNILLAVDAIQAIGNYPINVADLGISFMAAGAQKWQLTPWGAGFLYVSKKNLQKVSVTFDGWLSRFPERKFGDLLNYDLPLPNDASQFECGSPIFPCLVGYENSLSLIQSIGVENIHRHSIELADILIDKAKSYRDWEIVSPMSNRSAIVCIKMPNAQKLYEHLVSDKVIIAMREGALRFAFHLYNTEEDIEKLFCSVERFYKQ